MFMIVTRSIFAGGLIGLLAACATMTPEECAVADWERIGEMDARAGYAPSHFARRAADCAEAGYPADQNAWTQGWDQGIVWFCTPNNGFRKGLEGYRYEGICPRRAEQAFLSGYDTGLAIHDAQSRLGRTSDDIERAERRLERLLDAQPRDPDAIERARERLAVLKDRKREEELELARLQGVAQGQGFPVRL